MNILVVNDDGIEAEGILHLVQALSKVANVYVCAPDSQRSAKSQAITIGESVTVNYVDFPGATKAIKTSGTPADCTKIGLQFFQEEGIIIDMVYSGINMGSNLGHDTLYSGTVGAAMEAAISGVHAVAVSVDDHMATFFDAACDMAVQVIPKIMGKMDPKIIININTPNLPKEKIKGVKITSLGGRYYIDKFTLVDGNKFELTGAPEDYKEHSQELDVSAIHNDYATITPLQFDYTDYESLNKIKDWKINL